MSNLNRPGYCPERQSDNQRSDRDTKGRSGGAGDYGADHGPRMEHGLNTDKERNSYGFGKRGDDGEDTKALSLATRSFTWKVSFGNPCSIRVPSVARLKILSKMKDFFF